MADLVTQQIVNAGTAPNFVAADAAGDSAEVGSGSNTFLVVKNANASTARQVTIGSDLVLDSGAPYPAKSVSVAASSEVWVPLIKDYLETDTPGRCAVTYDVETDLTVAVVRR